MNDEKSREEALIWDIFFLRLKAYLCHVCGCKG